MPDPQTVTNTPTPDQATPGDEYADRSKILLGDLDKKLDDEGVQTAIIIVIDPKIGKPIVYRRGHPYEVVRAICSIGRRLKQDLLETLSI